MNYKPGGGLPDPNEKPVPGGENGESEKKPSPGIPPAPAKDELT